MRVHCTDHCSECDQHFHSLQAFDAHLVRMNFRKNRFGASEYDIQHALLVPGDESQHNFGLEAVTENGICSLSRPEAAIPAESWPAKEGIRVWRRKRSGKFHSRKPATPVQEHLGGTKTA